MHSAKENIFQCHNEKVQHPQIAIRFSSLSSLHTHEVNPCTREIKSPRKNINTGKITYITMFETLATLSQNSGAFAQMWKVSLFLQVFE